MVVEPGEKLFIVTRRLFENDLRRHFVGEVKAVTERTVRLEGYPFVMDTNTGQFVKKERRVWIFGIGDSGFIIIIIPRDVNLDKISYTTSKKGWKAITDGNTFEMELAEFSHYR